MFAFSSRLWYNKQRISKTTNEASLYLQVVIDSKHKPFELKLKWPVDKIDVSKNKLFSRFKEDPDVADYNLIIKCALAQHTEIQRIYRLRNEYLTLDKFTREMKTFDGRECFITYFRNEADRRFEKKEIELKTHQNHKAVLRLVMQFDELSLFKNIDKAWLGRFRNFLSNATYGKDNKPYKPGTIWDRVKTTLAYLALAKEEKMIYVNEEVFKFINPKPEEETSYLSRDEVRRLMLLTDHYLTERELRILKAFLFACFTGLRISDLYLVGAKWEIQENFLDFIPQKNKKKGRKIRIPLIPIARSFVKSHGLTFFDLPNQVQFNESLKIIADKALISKVLTAHVARHTFGYLYMTTIGDIYGLQKILGHKKIDTTQRYAHIDDDYKYDTAAKIQEGFGDLMLKIAT